MLKGGREKRTEWWAADKAHDPPAAVGWWMIRRSGTRGFRAMTLPCFGEAALAIFGHEEEAELFLRFLEAGGHYNGWRIREGRRGEVASVLYGQGANAKRVVLDPLPSMVEEGTVALASMDRGSFMAHLLACRHIARR